MKSGACLFAAGAGVALAFAAVALLAPPIVAQPAGRPSQCGAISADMEAILVRMTDMALAVSGGRLPAQPALADLKRMQGEIEQRQALLAAHRCYGGPPIQSAWVARGTGDCPANDVGSSEGAVPKAEMCAGAARSAVCWDGDRYRNGAAGRAWCTYKSIPAATCRGGGAPGLLYACGG